MSNILNLPNKWNPVGLLPMLLMMNILLKLKKSNFILERTAF